MTPKDRVLLPVRRFRQRPAECALAAAASMANYYDPSVRYRDVREMLKPREKKDGIFTSQQARLLNELGFPNVTVVTAEQGMVDFSWSKLSKTRKIERLRRKAAYYGRIRDTYSKNWVNDMVDWLSDEDCNNRLIIDWDFAKHIRKGLDAGRPVGATLSWTSFFRKSKSRGRKDDDIKGEGEDHAIVLRGYDNDGVFVVDSHHQYYTGRLKRYQNGYYKIPWEKFLVNIPRGDLIIIR